MKNTLDLRQPTIEYSRPDFSWLAAYALAAGVLALGITYLAFLDHGCAINGIMTVAGKVCIN